VTKEQTIVLGFLVAAFVAGWVVQALTGGRSRKPAAPDAPAFPDGHVQRAIDDTGRQLDAAVRSYLTAIAASLGAADVARAEPADSGEATRTGLADEVSAALTDDAANQSMLSVMEADHSTPLSERELDLTDWGFAYGVAWARARDRDPAEPGDAIARAALQAADTVFRSYTAEADWEHPAGNGEGQQERGNGRPRSFRPQT
jgi:hypothetical protein